MKIEAENLSWAAGPAIIIDDIDVPAMPGRILGLLGFNRSGESTLPGMPVHTIQLRTGIVKLGNRPYGDWAPWDITRVLSVVQQKATTGQDVIVCDVIDLGRIPYRRRWVGSSPRDREVMEAAVRRTGIKHPLNRDRHTLSGDERQRVHLTRALAQEGQVMPLDEPTNHFGTSRQPDILKTLRGTDLGMIIALRDLNLATTFCDGVLIPREDRAVRLGCPADVLTEDLIREVYGVEVRILHPDGDETPLFQFLRPVT